jgi:metallo-beta-lactamase family protein
MIVFPAMFGRYNDATMVDPTPIDRADYLLVESTYGDRQHDRLDPADALMDAVGDTIAGGGTVVIPAFVVGRSQSLLFYFEQLKSSRRLPNVPILDSPTAQDASAIYCKDFRDHKLPERECRRACAVARYVRSVEESKALTANPVPKVIISASGMATGGRVLHHLKRYAPDPKNLILFAGFQAGGTRGAAMLSGAKAIKIRGEYVPVRAQVKNLEMLSAHADSGGILRWVRGFKAPPRMTFVIHGEPAASDALRHQIEEELCGSCTVPEYGQKVELK